MNLVQQHKSAPLVDPIILKDKRVLLVRDLDVETVLAGMKPFLVQHFSTVNAINAETNCGKKTGILIDFLQRFSVQEYDKFNVFLKLVASTQPDLFCELVGRSPSETEADFCVENYAESLKETIKVQGHSIDSILDEKIDLDAEHIQLALGRDEVRHCEAFDELPHRYQTHLSKVQDRDDNVPAVEVLASVGNEEKPKRVSLYGRAGTGKSTTFQWLAREWSFNRWAAEFTVIFLLQLRMLAVSGCQISAIELLTLHSLYQVQKADLVCLVSSWLKHSGAKLMILMDGLDEISGFSTRLKNCRKITDLNQRAHPIDICINILHGNLLPGSTVLSASRSFAGLSAVQFDRQFEILGLTESRVTELVERKHLTKAAHIMSVLRSNPLLMSISGITFYCVLISRLLADGVVFDNEELQTYTRLTAFILVQYVSRKLSDWPFVVEVSSYFSELASLAHNGIFEAQLNEKVSKLVFDEYDLSRAKLTKLRLNAILEVGLLQTKRVKVGTRSSVIAEFIHASVQEMLASAYLLPHLSPSDDIFSRLFLGGQFKMALLYLFGVQYDTGSNWIRDIRHSVNPSGQGLSCAAKQQMNKFLQGLCEQCAYKRGFSSQLQVCQLLHEGQMEEKAKCTVRYIVPGGKLTIRGTQMTLIDLMAICFVCKYAEVITKISLIQCGLTETLLRFLTSSLLNVHAEKLLVLDLADNNMGHGGAEAIIEWLKKNTTLHTLNLNMNKIGDNGATAIAAALRNNTKLQTLNVAVNRIGDNGATAIAAELHNNTKLQTLDVGHNNIGDNGATAIAEALQDNTTLQILDVGDNNIGDDGAKAIAAALQNNTTLQTLDVHTNNIGENGATAIAEALQDNTTLQILNVGDNNIGDDGATAIAEALQNNSNLQTLNVATNNIGENGATAIAAALKNNTTIQSLDVSGNFIGDTGIIALTLARLQGSVIY